MALDETISLNDVLTFSQETSILALNGFRFSAMSVIVPASSA